MDRDDVYSLHLERYFDISPLSKFFIVKDCNQKQRVLKKAKRSMLQISFLSLKQIIF